MEGCAVRGSELELVERTALNGVVESLAVLKHASRDVQRDAIVLTYREAKAAVLEWSDVTDSIAISSLHSFEDDSHCQDSKEVFALGPEVKTDPLGRCACVVFFGNQLALLPAEEGETLDENKTVHPAASVLDSVFLHGYNEPVLLILHEPAATWAALYKEKKDTRCLTAVSLNLKQKIYPVIWSAKHLPSDAYRLIPVPNGGALSQMYAVGVNGHAFGTEIPQKVETDASGEAVSVKQMLQKYATSVHRDAVPSIADKAKAEMLEVEVDAAVWCWVNDATILLALKTGQLLAVRLTFDRDNIHDISVTKSGAAPIASCLSVIGGDLLFIGSWLGDSLLVRFTPVQLQTVPSIDIPIPDIRADNFSDEEDMLFFAEDRSMQSTGSYHQFSFSVTDSLLCMGPIRDLATGAPPELDSGTQHTSLSPQLVACVGSGRSGALAIMRKGVVAEVLIEVSVPNIEAVWALRYRDESEHMSLAVTSYPTDAYLVIATAQGTMVLQSGEELEEVSDKSDFVVSKRTVFAGSLFEDTRMIQICSDVIRVLKGTELMQERTLEALLKDFAPSIHVESTTQSVHPSPLPSTPEANPSDIKHQSTVFYDFGSLNEDNLSSEFMMDDHALVPGDLDSMGLDVQTPTFGIQSASLCDPLVLMILHDNRGVILEGDPETKTLSLLNSAVEVLYTSIDDDPSVGLSAACLYGDASGWMGQARGHYKMSIYCIVCRLNGKLEILSLPDVQTIRTFSAFPIGRSILKEDSPEIEDLSRSSKISEIRMESFDRDPINQVSERRSHITRPVLLALLEDGTLLMYRGFLHDGRPAFRRMDVDDSGDVSHGRSMHHSRMVKFRDLGERHPCNGIFLSGSTPVFFVLGSKGLFVHRLLIEGAVSSMTPFSNINCPRGFILAMTNDQLKICTLHKELLEAPWPCSKIPLRCTPHKLAWYPDARLYIMLCSSTVHYRDRPQEEDGGDAHASAVYVAEAQSAKERGTEEGHEVNSVMTLLR